MKIKRNKLKLLCFSIFIVTNFSTLNTFAKTKSDYTSSQNQEVIQLKENIHVVFVNIYNIGLYEYIQIDLSNGKGYSFSTSNLVRNNYSNDSRCVESLQALLIHYGYSLSVNGIFNENTFNALIDYQKKHSDCNRIDGTCDKYTWRSLVNNFI